VAAAEDRLDGRSRVSVGRQEQPRQEVDQDADAAEDGQDHQDDSPQHRVGVGRTAEGAADAGEEPSATLRRPHQPVPPGERRDRRRVVRAGSRRWS
jgi:hypothetical protein